MTAPHRCGSGCIGEHDADCYARWQRRKRLHVLCRDWNELTNPSAMRSDAEHAECNKLARVTMEKLRAEFREGVDYREAVHNSGLIPL